MKSASIPSLRVTQELRQAAEDVLQEGESLSSFIEQSLRANIERRRVNQEFVARGLAGRDEARRTGEYFDDAIVTTKVKSAILADSRLRSMDITVNTFKGAVQLSGFVNSPDVAARAVQVVRTIKGVRVVNNSLVVK